MTPTEALTRLLSGPAHAGARRTRLLRPLHLGPLAHSWLLEYGDEQAVLRIDQPAAAALGLDRAAEFARLAAVAAAGLGPPPIAVDAAQGLLLRRHVAGRAWQAAELGQAVNLERAAALLRRVHAAQIDAPPLDLRRGNRPVRAAGGARGRRAGRDLPGPAGQMPGPAGRRWSFATTTRSPATS